MGTIDQEAVNGEGPRREAAPVERPDRRHVLVGSGNLITMSPVDINAIMSGPEPSIKLKRLAKEAAWANGSAPQQTAHHVYLGDARSMAALHEPVHLIVTSPPYFDLVAYEGCANDGQLGSISQYEVFLDELDKVWHRCHELLMPGGRMCVVVGSVCVSRRRGGRHHVLPLPADITVRARRMGFDYITPIFWQKIANMTTEVGGGRFLGKPYEPGAVLKNDMETILMLRKRGGYRQPTPTQRALSLIDASDYARWFQPVWADIRGESRKRGHPAPYPVELAARLIQMFSFVGDTVLDPFWGTGTTTVAAMQTARNSIGYEIELEYVDIARDRLSQVDGLSVPSQVEFAV